MTSVRSVALDEAKRLTRDIGHLMREAEECLTATKELTSRARDLTAHAEVLQKRRDGLLAYLEA